MTSTSGPSGAVANPDQDAAWRISSSRSPMLPRSPYPHVHGCARHGRRRDPGPRADHVRGYIRLALNGPGGFFESPPVGPDGHFVTSPHVHPVFAELLAPRDRRSARPARRASPLPGDGGRSRRRDARSPARRAPGGSGRRVHGSRDERRSSPCARSGRRRRGPRPPGGARRSSILANELMDNMPFRRLRGTASGSKEVMIGLEGDRFVEHLAILRRML